MAGDSEVAPNEAAYFPSDFTIIARLSSWCASAVQLREMFISTADRRAEILGSAPRILYSAAYALHCSTDGIYAPPADQSPSRVEGNLQLSLQFLSSATRPCSLRKPQSPMG